MIWLTGYCSFPTAVRAKSSSFFVSVKGEIAIIITTFDLNTKITAPVELFAELVTAYSTALSPIPLTALAFAIP